MRYRWDPAFPMSGRRSGSPDTGDLRVSDAERNEVADKLSRHFADGRLDQTEFKERLDTAMSAKTQNDLDGLFDDLPRLHTEAAPPPSRRRRLIPFLLIIAFVAVAATSTFSFVSGLHLTWLLFVLAGLFFWSRVGRRHRHYDRSHAAIDS
jgi:Flp pilus assembly protein TadB